MLRVQASEGGWVKQQPQGQQQQQQQQTLSQQVVVRVEASQPYSSQQVEAAAHNEEAAEQSPDQSPACLSDDSGIASAPTTGVSPTGPCWEAPGSSCSSAIRMLSDHSTASTVSWGASSTSQGTSTGSACSAQSWGIAAAAADARASPVPSDPVTRPAVTGRMPQHNLAGSIRAAAAAAVGAAAATLSPPMGAAGARLGQAPSTAASACGPGATAAAGSSSSSGARPPAPLQRLPSAPAAPGGDPCQPLVPEPCSPKLPSSQDSSPRVRRRGSRLYASGSGGCNNPSRLSHTSAAHGFGAGAGGGGLGCGGGGGPGGGRPGSSCGEAAGGLLMPSLPQVDFIERIGKGSFGEVFKGGCEGCKGFGGRWRLCWGAE